MTQHAVSKPRKPARRAYTPIPPETWSRLLKYLIQEELRIKDPSAPEPDINLLADAHEHDVIRRGSVVHLSVVTDEASGLNRVKLNLLGNKMDEKKKDKGLFSWSSG